MDIVQWIIVLLIVFLFVALILPSKYNDEPSSAKLQKAMEKKKLMERKPTCEAIGTCARPCHYNNLVAEKKRLRSQASIDAHFQQPKTEIPNDYPLTQIGCCPYGKPLSRDLPIADIPMCVVTKSNDMRLHVSNADMLK